MRRKPSDKNYSKEQQKEENEKNLSKADTGYRIHLLSVKKWLNWLCIIAVASIVVGRICATIGFKLTIGEVIEINEPFDLLKELILLLKQTTNTIQFICICFSVCFMYGCKIYKDIKTHSQNKSSSSLNHQSYKNLEVEEAD